MRVRASTAGISRDAILFLAACLVAIAGILGYMFVQQTTPQALEPWRPGMPLPDRDVTAGSGGVWIAIVGGLAMLAAGGIWSSGRMHVGPSEALLIFGRAGVPKDPSRGQAANSCRVVTAGRVFVWPLFEKVLRIPLGVRSIDIRMENLPTEEGIPCGLQAVAQVRVGHSEAMVLLSAISFGGLEERQVDRRLSDLLEGVVRSVCGKVSLEQIAQQKDWLARQVESLAQAELAKVGYVFVSFHVSDVFDRLGYLEAMRRKKVSEVKRNTLVLALSAAVETSLKELESKFLIERSRLVAEAASRPENRPEWFEQRLVELGEFLNRSQQEISRRFFVPWIVVEPMGPEKLGKIALELPARCSEAVSIPAGVPVKVVDWEGGVASVMRD